MVAASQLSVVLGWIHEWHTDENTIPGSQGNGDTTEGMAPPSQFSMPQASAFLSSMPSMSKDHALQCGPYGEKTLHLGLEQLVNSIQGAQSSRDISINTQSWSENYSARSHSCCHSPKCLWDTIQLIHSSPSPVVALCWAQPPIWMQVNIWGLIGNNDNNSDHIIVIKHHLLSTPSMLCLWLGSNFEAQLTGQSTFRHWPLQPSG